MIPIVLHLLRQKLHQLLIYKEACGDANSTPPSASKVETIETEQTQENDVIGYRFMDMEILKLMFSCLACPECFRQEIIIEDINSKKKGLARYLALKRSSCDFVRNIYSSKTVESDRGGMKLFVVNVRTVYGLRAIAGGFSSLQKYCGYLNMAKPLTQKNFDRLLRQVTMATKHVAEKSMSGAALELRETEIPTWVSQ